MISVDCLLYVLMFFSAFACLMMMMMLVTHSLSLCPVRSAAHQYVASYITILLHLLRSSNALTPSFGMLLKKKTV